MANSRSGYLRMNPHEFHKHLINNYVLNRRGTTKFLQRDSSRDKRDSDVIREHHKFLWDDDDVPQTWEDRLAKKYYDKLFKEFCITDLSRYKENKFAMRWQTEQELITGKGQFVCSNKRCDKEEHLRTWEVNFSYEEFGQKKNALVKLRLCHKCSTKLNYRHKKKEIKRLKDGAPQHLASKSLSSDLTPNATVSPLDSSDTDATPRNSSTDKSDRTEGNPEDSTEESMIWQKPIEIEEPSREEEFEKYLEHLLM